MATENTHYGAERIRHMLAACKAIYFIGIGGINMSSLAHLTHQRGYRTGGSDRVESALTRRLAACGVEIFYTHAAEQLQDYDAVVYTVAISRDNPEYCEAHRRGLPCISRADYMGYLMADYTWRIGVSGMHGKSSCTSMCASVLMESGADPTVLSGAELAAMEGAYRIGGKENFLFEACEYMDSFLDFSPNIAVVLNIEMDHVDYFHSMEQIRRSFACFASKTGKEGYAVYNADDPETVRALADYKGTHVRFGIHSRDAEVSAAALQQENGCYSFDLMYRGERLCRISLSVSGAYQVYNALACAAVSLLRGLSAEQIAKGLHHFGGAARRMEYRGMLNGARVYDDYGHHPTEVRATLEGAACLGKGRLFCVYQPHTYSRTAALLEEFATAFEAADRVILADIYAAREQNTFGIGSDTLAERIGERAVYGGDNDSIARMLCEEVNEGDTVVIMGAGNINRLFDHLPITKKEIDA